jgi:hypothetical protein
MSATAQQISGRLESGYLSEHDTAGTTTEWGVFSFSRTLGRHVLDSYERRADAVDARDRIAHFIDASALLVHREVITGRWTPDTVHGGAA